MSTMIKNPNHIGCHTMGHSESFFSGTHQLERDVIDICACDILEGNRDEVDGYVASGGTEANLQAVWVYRNYFQQEEKVEVNQIAILCSEDTHYSADKAGNVFGLKVLKVPVHKMTRAIQKEELKAVVSKAKNDGNTCFIVLSNMMTTMFGSIDDVNLYAYVGNNSVMFVDLMGTEKLSIPLYDYAYALRAYLIYKEVKGKITDVVVEINESINYDLLIDAGKPLKLV